MDEDALDGLTSLESLHLDDDNILSIPSTALAKVAVYSTLSNTVYFEKWNFMIICIVCIIFFYLPLARRSLFSKFIFYLQYTDCDWECYS